MKIEVRIDNPYITGYIVEFQDGGDPMLLRKQLEYQPAPNDAFYAIEQSKDLSDISFDYYGNSKNWWLIGDINSIINPFDLTLGKNIIIPDINKILATSI